jgi:hypothetical protein
MGSCWWPHSPSSGSLERAFASLSRELGITQGICQRRFEESGQDDPAARRLPLDMTEILRLRREGESFTVIGRRFDNVGRRGDAHCFPEFTCNG